jgi:hypothetical protein
MNSSILVRTTFSSLANTYVRCSSGKVRESIASIANATPLAFIEGLLILTRSTNFYVVLSISSAFSLNWVFRFDTAQIKVSSWEIVNSSNLFSIVEKIAFSN